MTDIFVSKEIAQKLKKIGFEELCMAYYQGYEGFDNLYVSNIETDESISTLTDTIFVCNHNVGDDEISAPTYEQVLKWFRERNCLGYIKYYSDVEKYACFIYLKNKAYCPEIIGFYETYEESRDELILKLIELYQNKQNGNAKRTNDHAF